MPSADFFSFLSKSIDLLKRESGENYARLAAELKGLRINISASANARLAYFSGGQFVIESDLERADIWLEFEECTILAVIDGKYSLEEAVLGGEIFIRGNVRKMETLHSALAVYLDGALRSPGFPELLADYRRAFSLGG
jgi:hypothetical protein